MKRCEHCKARFEPQKGSAWTVCSIACAIEWGKTERAKATVRRAKAKERREDRAAVETLASLRSKAQAAINKYVRVRDAGLGCVACNHPDDGSRQRHASHYRPAGSNPALRFEPDNIHASCQRCNTHLSGNLMPYRYELVQRIGLDRVEWLEGPHPVPKYTREHLRELRRSFDGMTRHLLQKR